MLRVRCWSCCLLEHSSVLLAVFWIVFCVTSCLCAPASRCFLWWTTWLTSAFYSYICAILPLLCFLICCHDNKTLWLLRCKVRYFEWTTKKKKCDTLAVCSSWHWDHSILPAACLTSHLSYRGMLSASVDVFMSVDVSVRWCACPLMSLSVDLSVSWCLCPLMCLSVCFSVCRSVPVWCTCVLLSVAERCEPGVSPEKSIFSLQYFMRMEVAHPDLGKQYFHSELYPMTRGKVISLVI